MARQKRVTIKEVAREAGVSTQTVSRVLNERPDVASATRQKVREVIDRLGYRPSHVARSLIQGKSASIAVVSYGIEYFGPSRVISGIEKQASELGYSTLLSLLRQPEETDVEKLLDTFLSRHVDGIIWAVPEIGSNRDWLEQIIPELPVPIVFITMKTHPLVTTAAVDNRVGGLEATNHLIDNGNSTIGHITGPLDWWEARERLRGWQAAMQAAGREADDEQVAKGNWSAASGEKGLIRLIEKNPGLDAIFVANDQMALGALQAARRLGMRIPQDLAVIGFDDIAEAAYFWPPLSTMRQPLFELGCRAVEALGRMLAVGERTASGEASQAPNVLLKPELIVRESSACN